jgi:hypothetical protein
VAQLRGHADFAQEALAAEHRGHLRVEDFDGDLALVSHVAGEVHARHSAAPDLTLDRVAAAQRISQ